MHEQFINKINIYAKIYNNYGENYNTVSSVVLNVIGSEKRGLMCNILKTELLIPGERTKQCLRKSNHHLFPFGRKVMKLCKPECFHRVCFVISVHLRTRALMVEV